jgi:3-oxoacyl-(acyl-carrier-protein) synthase/3-hydroxymyristoyl/3-hydroxydecanoyl-(acyl carrier protein) dehydratase
MTNLSPIAIVGIGGIFPDAPSLDQFWFNIREGLDAAREPPPGRWYLSVDDAFDARIAQLDKVYSKRGCFVEGFQLDPEGLDIDRTFLDQLDPVFHLALHAGRQAWQDAVTQNLDRRRVGVILGNIVLPTEYSSALAREYLGRIFEEEVRKIHGRPNAVSHRPDPSWQRGARVNRRAAGMPAAILAKALGLGAGHYTLDAACASSLYAIKLAVDELQTGRTDAMLTGGLSRPDCLYTQMGFSQLRALSTRGRCAPFDTGADGLVVGEGAGMFVLKRLDDAIRDDDHVYAVIAGIGISNDVDGKLLAPSSEGQLRALRAAYRQAGWDPQDVDLIECHGTGTPAGDGVELESLRLLWEEPSLPSQCVIGSVKSNVGHTLTAAGSAGLLKVLLALREQTLPPTANFSKPVAALAKPDCPFRVLSKPQPWDQRQEGRASRILPSSEISEASLTQVPRRAAVTAFGFGGINAHVLLEEWIPIRAKGVDLLVQTTGGAVTLIRGEQGRHSAAIAIVGLGAYFGPWANRHAFQERLFQAGSVSDGGRIVDAPRSPGHWWGAEKSAWFQHQMASHGALAPGPPDASFDGYFIDQISVPADQFRIPPRELQDMLPQQVLALLVAAEAIAGARWNQDQLLRTGAFIGLSLDMNTTNFHFRWSLLNRAREWNHEFNLNLSPEDLHAWVEQLRHAAGPPLTANRTMGALGGVVASRVAREFRIGGPSFTLSCEENSGLRALAVAARLLQQGELHQALVAAVDLPGDLRVAMTAQTEELPIGEGAAAVVLKRLENAQRDGDRIYAVIRGINSNSGDILESSERAQGGPIALEQALQEAQFDANDVDLSPTHVSGDIGHCGASLGLASLVKASLRLCQESIENSVLRPSQSVPPGRCQGPKQVAISSHSSDGNCITISLEQADWSRGALSAKGRTSLGVSQTVVSEQPKAPSELNNHRVVVPVGGKPFQIPKAPFREAEGTRTEEENEYRASNMDDGASVLGPRSCILNPLTSVLVSTQAAKAAAHEAFLRFSQNLTQTYAGHLEFQMSLLKEFPPTPVTRAISVQSNRANGLRQAVAFDRDECIEFAVGSIARVLGPAFTEVDSFPTRVRLPDEPLMLVDRIVSISGVPRSMQPGKLVTAHDIRPGAWYLDNDHIPPCIAIEAGQADLFLSAFLGIDFQTRGKAVYRLLDAVVTFHRGLPGPGETIRYDIRIERFFRQGNTWFFRFQFDGTVNGEPLLTMREGCAGFFSAEELAAGKGVVERPGSRKQEMAFAPLEAATYDARQLDALRAGDFAACFGRLFEGVSLQAPLRLPSGRMNLVHRVTHLDPQGGRYSRGVIRAEADIHPDDWFLTCHFVDDRVMPGTLMYECCLHTLRIFFMRSGWIGEQQSCTWEPVPGVASRLKCRGQVVESTRVAAYEVSIKELGFRPEPYAIADALMYADGKAIVEITDMTLQLAGTTQEKLQAIWGLNSKSEIRNPKQIQKTKSQIQNQPVSHISKFGHSDLGFVSDFGFRISDLERKVLFDHNRILAFAIGKPSDAFGDPYRPFDQERFIARLPGPPYQFLDRITAIEAEPWKMKPGGIVETQYDVPPDEWYFAANRQERMPYAILLEVALQSCGWTAAYMGSALTSSNDLHFRNLGGQAIQFAEVTPRSGTLTTTVKVTKVSNSAGMIIQHYDFDIRAGNQLVYRGNTYFGFFTREALAQQVGIRDAAIFLITAEDRARGKKMEYPSGSPFPDAPQRMIDRIDLYLPDGGPHGLGLILGSKKIDPEEWFFKAHFYQDPVWPGSLGLEALVQLLKVAAAERWQVRPDSVFETVVLGKEHRWLYRGQVLPTNRQVSIQAELTTVDDARRRIEADAFLSVDGRIIYHMSGFSVGLR